MNKKHILFLTPGFAKDEADTPCIPAIQLFIEELNKRNLYAITIISFHYPFNSSEYEWKGVKVYSLGGKNLKGLRRILLFIKAARLSVSINKNRKIDFIHSFWFGECAWLGQKISRKLNVPISCTLMGQEVKKGNRFLKRIKGNIKIIALSKFQAKLFKQNASAELNEIIPWGIEYPSFEKFPRTIDILGVGNLITLKAFDRFIDIILLLKKMNPSIYSEIIGKGTELNFLNEKINKLGLQDHVKLIGELDRADVLRKMSQSKTFLHCSSFESFGMVLVEALSSNAAVFSTAVGIAHEIDSIQTFKSNEEAFKLLNNYLNSEIPVVDSELFLIKRTVDCYINSVF